MTRPFLGDPDDPAGLNLRGLSATAGDIKAPGTQAAGVAERAAAADHVHPLDETINFIIDGGGATITTGIKGDLVLDFAGKITGWTILADQSGSIVVDVWKDTYANFPPVVADTITGAEKPTIATATKGQDTSLNSGAGWAFSVGDILRFNVDSATSCRRVTVALRFVRI